MVQGMHNPPMLGYKPLQGSLFPSEYPFDYSQMHDSYYFWIKYFISRNSYFSIPKRPIYVNYEALINALNMNVIDFSQAEIHELRSDQMTEAELEKLLELHNLYSEEQFKMR